MVVSAHLNTNKLTLKYRIGVNSKGEDVFKTQSFNNINTNAPDEKLMEFAEKLQVMLDYTVNSVNKLQNFTLIKE